MDNNSNLKLIPKKQTAWMEESVEAQHLTPAHEAGGEEAWLISYADLMTLLVGFFIVLQSFSKIDSSAFEEIKKETVKLFGGEYKMPFAELSKDLEQVVKDRKLEEQVLFHRTPEGVEITFRGALFFESGSWLLRDEAVNLLDQLIPVISAKAKGFGIVVEGHTDSAPLNASKENPVGSNWELSSIRACQVLRLFESRGFESKNLQALGWGATRPIVDDRDANGNPIPERQAQNRRVIIKVLQGPQGGN